MKWWSYLLIGFGTYLFFMLLLLPAQHVLGWTAGDMKTAPLTYVAIKGSLWRGKMEAVKVLGTPLDKLKWRFAPTELLFGRVGFDIKLIHAGQELDGDLSIGFSEQIYLEDISGQLPAEMIPPMIDLRQIGVDGKITLNLEKLILENSKITSAEGQIEWRDFALTTPFALKVGNLQADFMTDDNGEVKAKIKDLGGPTGVDGELSLTSAGNFQVKGLIKPGTDSDPNLGNALNAISKQQPDGSYRITYSMQL
jgi:hypothetical protein